MFPVLLLIALPLFFAGIILFARKHMAFKVIVGIASATFIGATVYFLMFHFNNVYVFDLSHYEWLKYVLAGLELIMAGYIIYKGLVCGKLLAPLFSLLQIILFMWYEFFSEHEEMVTEHSQSIYIDKLSVLMVAIVGIIGSLICVYAAEYMNDYHNHHKRIKDRRPSFFSLLFVFMSAMFGLVMCNDMTLMLFFWEVTSLCSFLLIGYTREEIAIKNAFTAITINVFGGLCFTAGIVLLGVTEGIGDFNSLLSADASSKNVIAAVFLIACAGLTKSAQLPFSKWLLGAMVAPTPTSAMLHSSTMVKAGVYLIIRLSPMFGQNAAGVAITLIGGITFFVTAVLAVSQSDAKKVLAYSTISNLGLIVACAGINTPEALWASIMLIVFHAIAKSLLFLTVGSTEHQIGGRNVEDMDGLFAISRKLTILMIIGIAGMFLAPFGMLISKWAAMKAFVDSGDVIIILLLAFGSTVTLFFWTKWMGKLIENAHRIKQSDYKMGAEEKISLFTLAGMVVLVCVAHPLLSDYLIIPYIDEHMHIANFASPIDPVSAGIIIGMMVMLFFSPLILIPLYNIKKPKFSSIYLSGENAAEDDAFYGGMGEIRHVALKNWYMKKTINEGKLLFVSNCVGAVTIGAGFFIALGGALF